MFDEIYIYMLRYPITVLFHRLEGYVLMRIAEICEDAYGDMVVVFRGSR